MNLRGRIPIEPLDEDRVVNIERNVVSSHADAMARGQRAGVRWLLPVLTAAAVAAVVAAVLVWKLRPVTEAVIPTVAAPVRIEATPTGSSIDLGDATLAVAPGTAVVVTRPEGGVLIALERGHVGLEVASRTDRAPLIVRAGDVDVVVVGTRFSVERDADVTVEVSEGVVRVQRAGHEARVAAGQRWSAPAQIAAGAAFPEVTAIAVAVADADGTGGAGTGTGGTIASGELATTPDLDTPGLHGREAGVPPPDDRPRTGAGSGSSGRHGSGSSTGAGSALDPQPISKTAELGRTSVAKPMDVGVTGDEALVIYRKMMGGNTEEVLRGYYGAAHVLRSQGKTGEALKFLDGYADRNPMGADIDDVLWMRIQILCKRQVDQKCRVAASAYVRRFPGSGRAELANRITHEIDD
jgi:hypothetical protein